MSRYGNLNNIQLDLLEQGFIDLNGRIDWGMSLYVRDCIARLVAKGSPEVLVFLTSNGGDLDRGLDIFDIFRLYKGKKTCLIQGVAASIATVIPQAFEWRQCLKHSKMIFHLAGHNGIGLKILRKSERIKSVRDDLEKSQQDIYNIMIERTKEREEIIKKLFEDECELSSEEALKVNLIDEII